MSKERFRNVDLDEINTKADIVVIDKYKYDKLVMISAVANNALLKKVKHTLDIASPIYIDNGNNKPISCSTNGLKYDVFFKTSPNNDDGHLVANCKDLFDDTGMDEEIICYIYQKHNDMLTDLVFDKLYKYTSIPMLREWLQYLCTRLISDDRLSELDVITVYNPAPFKVYRLKFTPNEILEYIQIGLRHRRIEMMANARKSELFDNITGIDSYLSNFGDVLARRIQNSFVPMFNPITDSYDEYTNYFDDSCHYNGIDLYPIQKAAIQSSVNNLKKNKVNIIVGEMGIGKTILAAGISYVSYHKMYGSSNLILCPSHLIPNWKREVAKYVPNAKTYIIRNIEDIKKYDHLIRDKYKKEHSYFILSKEAAKFSYEKRPCAVWSKDKKGFICPECGQLLLKRVKNIDKKFVYVPLEPTDFLKEYAINKYCTNKVTVFNKESNEYVEERCGSKLWTTLNKNEEGSEWIKLGSIGWILKKHLVPLYNKYNALVESGIKLDRRDNDLYAALLDAKLTLDSEDKLKGVKAPRKYSVSKYLKENYKNVFDYLILDELQKYYGGSLQGFSALDLCKASKHVIGLTGTLMNGYAKGLFYMLYRLFPRTMNKEGYSYNSINEFSKMYGVSSKSIKYNLDNHSKIGPPKDNTLPGVSPMLFTKFLLENVVFISLSDIDGGLPAYREIPVGVEMDSELKEAYLDFESKLRYQCSFGGNGGYKILGNFLISLSVFPDMPYDEPPIYHPDTNELLITPPELSKGLRNKEYTVLNIVKEKIENGEKVLIYYEYTDRCDAALKLKKMFRDNDIRADILSVNSCKKAEEREEWIDKKIKTGTQVLICNPQLVETGLNLLDFTTIIFYQISYKLFTIRQASRRSWRLSQDKDVNVYFVYYKDTIQEQAMSLIGNKMNAALAIEGKFNEEGIRSMGDTDDISTKIAKNVVNGIKDVVEINTFTVESTRDREVICDHTRVPYENLLVHDRLNYNLCFDNVTSNKKIKSNKKIFIDILNGNTDLANYY